MAEKNEAAENEVTAALQAIWDEYIADQAKASDHFWRRQQEAAEVYQRGMAELWPGSCAAPAADEEAPDEKKADDDAADEEEAARAAAERAEETQKEMHRLCEEQARAIQDAWEESLDATRDAYRRYRERLAEAWSEIDLAAQPAADLEAIGWSLRMAAGEDSRMTLADEAAAAS